MNIDLIATLFVGAGSLGVAAWIAISIWRTGHPKGQQHPYHADALVKSMPSFDVYSAKNQRSLRIAAGSRK